MKKKFLLPIALSFFSLPFQPGMQSKIVLQNNDPGNQNPYYGIFEKCNNPGEGVNNCNSLTQSLASLSAEMAGYGIFIEFASSTMNANNSRENIFKEPFNGGCTRLDLPVENKYKKFSGFQSTLNHISSFDSNKTSYKKNFSSLIHSFSLYYSFKNPWENNLGSSRVKSNEIANIKKQSKPGLSAFTNKKIEGDPCDSTAMNCTWDPGGFIFDSADIIKTGKVYYGKYQPDTTIPNFYDVAYVDDNVDMLPLRVPNILGFGTAF